MQIFLLGKTKTGKTTLSNQIISLIGENNINVYEAGSWARREFKALYGEQDDFSQDFHENLTQYALTKLKSDPLYSFKQFLEWNKINTHQNTLIVGVRNPDDFIQMSLQSVKNKVIFLDIESNFQGTTSTFEKGLNIIKDYISWKQEMNDNFSFLKIDDINNMEDLNKFLIS